MSDYMGLIGDIRSQYENEITTKELKSVYGDLQLNINGCPSPEPQKPSINLHDIFETSENENIEIIASNMAESGMTKLKETFEKISNSTSFKESQQKDPQSFLEIRKLHAKLDIVVRNYDHIIECAFEDIKSDYEANYNEKTKENTISLKKSFHEYYTPLINHNSCDEKVKRLLSEIQSLRTSLSTCMDKNIIIEKEIKELKLFKSSSVEETEIIMNQLVERGIECVNLRQKNKKLMAKIRDFDADTIETKTNASNYKKDCESVEQTVIDESEKCSRINENIDDFQEDHSDFNQTIENTTDDDGESQHQKQMHEWIKTQNIQKPKWNASTTTNILNASNASSIMHKLDHELKSLNSNENIDEKISKLHSKCRKENRRIRRLLKRERQENKRISKTNDFKFKEIHELLIVLRNSIKCNFKDDAKIDSVLTMMTRAIESNIYIRDDDNQVTSNTDNQSTSYVYSKSFRSRPSSIQSHREINLKNLRPSSLKSDFTPVVSVPLKINRPESASRFGSVKTWLKKVDQKNLDPHKILKSIVTSTAQRSQRPYSAKCATNSVRFDLDDSHDRVTKRTSSARLERVP